MKKQRISWPVAGMLIGGVFNVMAFAFPRQQGVLLATGSNILTVSTLVWAQTRKKGGDDG